MGDFVAPSPRPRESSHEHHEHHASARDLVHDLPAGHEQKNISAYAIESQQVNRALEILTQNKQKAQKTISKPGYGMEAVWESFRIIASHEFAIRKLDSLKEYVEEREKYPSIYTKFVDNLWKNIIMSSSKQGISKDADSYALIMHAMEQAIGEIGPGNFLLPRPRFGEDS